MGRCPIEKLDDLKEVLNKVSKLKYINEKKLGLYYIKNKPFLHFHMKDGVRWADIRNETQWNEKNIISLNSNSNEKDAFFELILELYEKNLKFLNIEK